MAASGSNGDVADFGDDDERIAAQPGELGGELAGGVGVGEAGDPVRRGGERDALHCLAGPDGQAGGHLGLAGPGRPEEHQVAALGDEVQGSEVGDSLTFQ